ncbi:hypothetical protein YC2023_026809 [Brassica napus]
MTPKKKRRNALRGSSKMARLQAVSKPSISVNSLKKKCPIAGALGSVAEAVTEVAPETVLPTSTVVDAGNLAGSSSQNLDSYAQSSEIQTIVEDFTPATCGEEGVACLTPNHSISNSAETPTLVNPPRKRSASPSTRRKATNNSSQDRVMVVEKVLPISDTRKWADIEEGELVEDLPEPVQNQTEVAKHSSTKEGVVKPPCGSAGDNEDAQESEKTNSASVRAATLGNEAAGSETHPSNQSRNNGDPKSSGRYAREEPVRSFTRISRNRSRVKHITMRPSSEPRAECLYRTLQVASWEYILVDVS